MNNFKFLAVEDEPLDRFLDNLSIIQASEDEETGGMLGRRREAGVRGARRWLALGAASLAALGLAAVSLGLAQRSWASTLAKADWIQQKFYDANGAYWQAPGRGISMSEVWSSCDYPHMSTCDGYCCCDKGYYWKSPKTLYQEERSIAKSAAAGAAEAGRKGEVAAAESAVSAASKALAKAALASLTDKAQSCMPREETPAEVAQALADGDQINGSDSWVTCSTFTKNSHTCGSFCCCNGGHKWSAPSEACVAAE